MPNQMIALQARAPEIPSYNELIAGRDANMARRNALALQQQTMQQNAMMQQRTADAESASRNALQLAHGGDFAGAERQYGLGAGNMDVHKLLAGLQTEQRDQLHTKLASIVPAATAALNTADPAQRAAIFQAAAPQLVQSGWTQEQIASFPLTDDALTSAIENARDPVQAMAAFAESQKPYTLAPNQERRVGSTVIARNEAPEGLQYIQLADGTWQAVPKTAPAGAAPGAPGGDVFSRMIGVESGGQHFNARGAPLTSPAGAIGIAQVMPATAPEAAALAGLPFDENRYRTDRDYNLALGQAYFNKQRADFGDDRLAAAAYNAGPGAVRRALRAGGQTGWLAKLPAETQAYVANVFGSGAASPTSGQPFGPTTPPKPPKTGTTTEDERKIASNVRNMLSASRELAAAVQEDASAMAPGGGEYAAGMIPFYGSEAAQWMQSGARQRFNSALEKILAGVTFINTGAGVSETQMNSYRRSYFPTIQDTPRTRQQKMLGVIQFIRDAKVRAGNAWTPELDASLNQLQNLFGRAATFGSAPTASAGRASSGVRVTKVAD